MIPSKSPIPKQVFFLWFGDDPIPKYAENAMNTFKKVNPEFTIDLIEKSISDIESDDIKDEILKKSVEITKREHEKATNPKPFVISLSDVYRKILIDRYGGIYLDLDTFPIKPFDDYLLSQGFMGSTYISENHCFMRRDIFFIGCKKDGFRFNLSSRTLFPNLMAKVKNKYLADKFFNGTIKYGERVGSPEYNYIDHYCDYTWKPGANRITPCKYDIPKNK